MGKKHKDAVFYTDGACAGNPGPGGWAYVEVVTCDSGLKTNMVSGGKPETTNNEMELTAVYKALVKSYKDGAEQVTIFSDSAYVVNAIEKGWLFNWSRNEWKTKEGKDIKNKHIWEKVYKLLYEKRAMRVVMRKVSGHKGDPLNELVDRSAVQAKQKYTEGGAM